MNKIVIFVLSAGIIMALAIIGLSNCPVVRRSETRWLDNKLQLVETLGSRTSTFFPIVYPYDSARSRISFSAASGLCKSQCLKLDFAGSDDGSYVGIHLVSSVVLQSYIPDAMLEFWVKGMDNAAMINRLDVSLREWSGFSTKASFSAPVSLDKTWQKISIPLHSFQIIEKPGTDAETFAWHVTEVLFTVNAFASDKTAEIYIDCIRITQNGQIISELT